MPLSRFVGWLALAAVALALAAPAPSTAQYLRPRCESCGRFIDTSPARMHAIVRYNDHDRTFNTCSVFCLCEILEDIPDYELKSARIRDYTSAKEKDPLWLDALKAVYLSDATGDEQKTSRPFTYAFADEQTAKQYQQEVGGEVLDWKSAFDKCVKAAADYEPNQPQPVHPPR